MLDIKEIRKDPNQIEKKIKTKEPEFSIKKVLELDNQVREMKTRVEQIKAQRNELSKEIGDLKRKGLSDSHLLDQVKEISEEAHKLNPQLIPLEARFQEELSKIPNIPMPEITNSQDPKDNVFIKGWKEKPTFDFPFKHHLELNEKLKIFDFERGAKISGTGWPVYRGLGARLEWALINYMIEINLKNGFEQWIAPLLVRPEILYGSGQLPKFENQQFKIHDEDYHLYLIPTAEISLNGLHYDEILPEESLPLKYMAYSPCFRREAGAAGKQERGLIRTHQFNKVEMFCFTKPNESEAIHEKMVENAEEILQGLELHYRIMLLVTGDMSWSSAKTYDIEAWLPGQERYYEVSSISNCTDFQARRSNIRYRPQEGGKPEYVHTLNGSGLATSRLMVSLIENNQNADGSVNIPKVLQKYLSGISKICPKKGLI